MLTTAAIAVASLSGAAGWELNHHLNDTGASAAAEAQWLIKLVESGRPVSLRVPLDLSRCHGRHGAISS